MRGITISDDGTKVYILSNTYKAVFQYNLNTQNIINLTSTNKSYSFGGTGPYSLVFNQSGEKAYLSEGFTNNIVKQYSLLTPWDVNTITYDNKSINLSSLGATNSMGAFINFNNNKLYFGNKTTKRYFEYTITDINDISQSSYNNNLLYFGNEVTGSPINSYVDKNSNYIYILDYSNDIIFQYDLNISTCPGNNVNISDINLINMDLCSINISNSNIVNSSINDSNVIGSDINNSTITSSTSINTNIIDSDIYTSTISNSRFYDWSSGNIIFNSNITDSNFYDYIFGTTGSFGWVSTSNTFLFDFVLRNYKGEITNNWDRLLYKLTENTDNVPTEGLETVYYEDYNTNSFTLSVDFTSPNKYLWYEYYDNYGNRYDPFIELEYADINVHFQIEGTTDSIVPDLVTINGNDQTSNIDSNGNLYFIGVTGINTIHIEKAGYLSRDIYLYFDTNQQYDYNIGLISSDDGDNILFKFRYPNLTNVASKRIMVYDLNTNQLIGSKYTSSTGSVTFGIDSTKNNYEFRLIYNDSNDLNYYSYLAKPVLVKIPKNENNGNDITEPFDIIVEGLGESSYTDVTTDTNVLIITNTVGNYTFIIDPDLNYCSRTYNINIPGDPDNYILQPYLIDSDNCSQVYMYTFNKATNQPIGNIDLYIYRQIPGGALQLVEHLVTDDTGIAISNLYAFKSYLVKIYYGTTEVKDFDLTISNARYNFFLNLDFTEGTTTKPDFYNIGFSDMNINTPKGYLYPNDQNNIRFWQDVSITNGTFKSNSLYNITIVHDGTTLLDKNYNLVAGNTLFTTSEDLIPFALFTNPTMNFAEFCGRIYVSGNLVYTQCSSFIVKNPGYWNLSGDLKNYLNTFSNFQKALFMVIVMLIFVTFATMFTRDNWTIFIIGAGILGFFNFLIGDTAMITVWAVGVMGGLALLFWKDGLR